MELQLRSVSPSLPWLVYLTAVLSVLAGIYKLWTWKRADDKYLKEPVENPNVLITPLTDLKWADEPPIALRPFKPKYNLTMAVESTSFDELIVVDKTYLDRIHLRRRIMQTHHSTIGLRPGSEAAVSEFYIWMTQTYLPRRFPTMYALQQGEKQGHLRNNVSSEIIPLQPSSTHSALHTLGSHVDTDFLFLLPSQETGKYHLEAFVTTFPSGFSTLEKLGLPLAAIHKPVPGYAAKLERSMDRFFANMPVGKIVKRANWTITTNDHLYCESGNHFYDGGDEPENGEPPETANTEVDQDVERQKKEVVIENCRLRCERQTLHRLPQSKALVFAFKTFLYTLAEVKEEGSGPELAAAIDGLSVGNVPDMEFYKRGVVWGEEVKGYLLS